ncbi:M3 family metallopeptidase [Methylovirgula sp. HY1]|uniref:M3 family metallopeptidase n=1 Tax=Methylovirgula sp. HY1 TaxID=2822761 RepID=UPI001C5AA38D|nr:M3 family metallopeptidase [Methylovirgula sp. HY1]QXX75960.1 Dipeptidyl carboxypeptidase [Methylovirgula sp. HY1]
MTESRVPKSLPQASAAQNPLLESWSGPFGIPPFDRVAAEHYRPAFDAAFAEHRAEIAAIADNPAPADFDNTIAALERAGRNLRRVSLVFFNLAGADTNDAIETVEREISPLFARHDAEIHLNDALFARVDAVYAQRDALGLDAEQKRVLERHHTAFRRAGAWLAPEVKARLAEIGERLATLGTQFSQNVLADEKAFTLVLDAGEELAGLPDWLVAEAAETARERGFPGKYVITLNRSSIEPFLAMSARRDLREKAWRAWISRGENGGATDNRALAVEMLRLRAERAGLLDYDSFAHFRLADTMAKTPDAAQDLLDKVWVPARARALREEAALQAAIAEEGANFTLAPWDWRYYAERRRKAEFDLDESEIKPYLQLDRMIEAVFFTAQQLFGLSFSERFDLPLYHADARAFDVTGPDGKPVALFIGDYYARPSKHGGAWMSEYREQEKLDGAVLPIIVNVLNFVKPAAGEACLLSFDDARTLFHEFGHALHGLLSDVTYPLLSGTSVARDFVEFPSQLYEHWLEQKEILRRFALHYRTNDPMPEALLEKLLAARQFNQGFATVEYTASALVDLALHRQKPSADLDILAVEKALLEKLGMPKGIVMRHRTPHFTHVFSGDSYAAGYYSYLWSEVLDADGFDAFVETGNIFDAEVARKLRDNVYAAGNRTEPEAAYLGFRGRAPSAAPLLKKRGLTGEAA